MAIMLQYIQYWMDKKMTFKPGDNSVHISWIRGTMWDEGFLAREEGVPSPAYDEGLVEAIKLFQRKFKREETGVCDEFTMRDVQRMWVIHGLRNYGIDKELDGTAPRGFYEGGTQDAFDDGLAQ